MGRPGYRLCTVDFDTVCVHVIVTCPEGHVTDLLSKYSILYGTLMLLVVTLVVVAKRWTANIQP